MNLGSDVGLCGICSEILICCMIEVIYWDLFNYGFFYMFSVYLVDCLLNLE